MTTETNTEYMASLRREAAESAKDLPKISIPTKAELEAMRRREASKGHRSHYERMQNEGGEGYGHSETDIDRTPDHKEDY